MIVIAVMVASWVAVTRSLNRQFGNGAYITYDDWPRQLKSLVENDADLRADVTPFGLSNFMGKRSIYRIKAGSQLGDKLIESQGLVLATAKHPKASLLMESLPSSWRKPDYSKCNWFATLNCDPSAEPSDLFLVVDDSESGEVIVLYKSRF